MLLVGWLAEGSALQVQTFSRSRIHHFPFVTRMSSRFSAFDIPNLFHALRQRYDRGRVWRLGCTLSLRTAGAE
jgi:hypothetical protein